MFLTVAMSAQQQRDHLGGNLTQEQRELDHTGHDHSGHDHSGHNHADHSTNTKAQSADSHAGHDHSGHDHSGHDHSGHNHGGKGAAQANTAHSADAHAVSYNDNCSSPATTHPHGGFDVTSTAIHHVSDANVYTIMDAIHIPLPCIIYNKERGLEFFSSGKFHAGHHDDGHHGYKDYVMHEGNIYRIACENWQVQDHFEVEGFTASKAKNASGKEIDKKYAIIGGKAHLLEAKTIWDAGILGGGITSFMDFSITKNIMSMILVSLLLFLMFRSVAKAYTRNPGTAPRGLQSVLEPVFLFIRDEVAVPFIGEKRYMTFLPFLMSIFFFVLGLNLWGQVPFLGSVNASGSLSLTLVLAILVFVVVNINGNKDYWKHIFWMPGVPTFVKPILAGVEIMGLFIKPLTLMLRLAGNISAGHIAILSFVGLIFIFGNAGQSLSGSLIGTTLSIPLTMFMMALELLVAFVQAFVFTILAASYIGSAIEEHHHHEENHH